MKKVIPLFIILFLGCSEQEKPIPHGATRYSYSPVLGEHEGKQGPQAIFVNAEPGQATLKSRQTLKFHSGVTNLIEFQYDGCSYLMINKHALVHKANCKNH